ncbi:hypothetical protein MYK68_16090 [Gordonia sp. PP30]|uniref:hypothetical protein n=1 Tax=Gordonia sp. PP30 TaxID=2935861 RepID=UPI001FFE3BAF|nr:hypothetical protein [Gordonia sp. PP30]UQE74232.1 hypothetical protein MYK68_16090 [Gordonia sp. PP30]
MSTTTIADMIEYTGKQVLDYLDRAAEVPTITMAGAQGDVLIVHANRKPATTPMPACVVAVASEASSNTHTMHPRGAAFWDAHQVRSDEDVMLGVLTVPAGSEVFLSHQEHGGLLVGEGTFEVRRQAELGRYVHD